MSSYYRCSSCQMSVLGTSLSTVTPSLLARAVSCLNKVDMVATVTDPTYTRAIFRALGEG